MKDDDRVSVLHTIDTPALDPQNPLFQRYPAMKLGVRESVAFYVNQLVASAASILESETRNTKWVVSAPPLYVLPAGANLIAWELFRILGARNGDRAPLRSVDLRYSLPISPPSRGADYSSAGVDERVRNRRSLHEGKGAPKPDPADFRDHHVLFVNDINVTGTQQRFVKQTLDQVQPAAIHWLYIFQVDPTLGRSHPEIEHSLNVLNLSTFEEFADVMCSANIDYTSRCVSRLFSYDLERVTALVQRLDAGRRTRLRELLIAENASGDSDYAAKVTVLQES